MLLRYIVYLSSATFKALNCVFIYWHQHLSVSETEEWQGQTRNNPSFYRLLMYSTVLYRYLFIRYRFLQHYICFRFLSLSCSLSSFWRSKASTQFSIWANNWWMNALHFSRSHWVYRRRRRRVGLVFTSRKGHMIYFGAFFFVCCVFLLFLCVWAHSIAWRVLPLLLCSM